MDATLLGNSQQQIYPMRFRIELQHTMHKLAIPLQNAAS
jgi:hypothetical protein